jgi:hypothetical protein
MSIAKKPSSKSRTKRKRKAPSVEEEKVHELMRQAEKDIKQAMEISPEAYLQRAKRSEVFPALIPRQRKKHSEWKQRMESEGILLQGRGRVRDPSLPMSKAVEQAFDAVQVQRFKQYMVHAKERGESYALRQLRKLGSLCPESFSKWQKPLLEAFMEQHDHQPEKNPTLRKIVEDTTRSDISPAENRNKIRKEFIKAARRFAKELQVIYGN